MIGGVCVKAQTPLVYVGHAHNDYQQKRPLKGALENGFLSIEIDVFLKNGKLKVAHVPLFLGCKKTLEEMYLNPLQERIASNGGTVYKGDSTSLILMIDFKSPAEKIFPVLDSILRSFPDLFTKWENNMKTWGPLTIMNSGKKARKVLTSATSRNMVIDGNLRSGDMLGDQTVFQRVSANFTTEFTWNGEGEMSRAERQKLQNLVNEAHANGKTIRFWKTKDQPAVWKVLLDAGVDWINVDYLSKFRTFYLDYTDD